MSTIRMQFSVQRGPCWAANSSSLYDLFAKEGAVEGEVDYDEGKGRGSFVFCDEEVLLVMCFLLSGYSVGIEEMPECVLLEILS